MKKCLLAFALAAAVSTAVAYLPPVEERNGIKVEIESFPQKLERNAGSPFSWPLGVTEVAAGAPRAFPVTVENKTGRPVTGTLAVWMNDDWDVAGPQGALTLAPGEKKTLRFTGTAKARALDALYPVHATFTPAGADAKAAVPHPIAVFQYRNPNAPRALPPTRRPALGPGVFALDRGFERTTALEVNGKTHQVAANGDASADWGARIQEGGMQVGDAWKRGFTSHPPYKKGAGFIWSDFPLELPDVRPIAVRVSNFLVSNGDQPPSDGVEYKILVLEDGQPPKELASHIVKKTLTWQDLSADISAYAGKKIALRLWTGPGPKMNTCCDGGGWGDVRLEIGPQPKAMTAADWAAREASAVAAAQKALADGAGENRYVLDADGVRYGAAIVPGERGLVDGVIAFTDGERAISYRGFTARVDTADGGAAPQPRADVRVEKGTLRVSWSIPGVARDPQGFPRLVDVALGPASERPVRVYAGFGNVIQNPKAFTLGAGGFTLSTRHVGADYANGLSVVQAVDVPPDSVVCDGAKNLFSLHAHHDATFTLVPSAKGAFEAARRFRAVSGYRKSPGRDALGSRMCLDQWGGDYAKAAADLRLAAKYGLNDTIFVKHDWQAWGYDYRLPEIYPPRGDAAAFGDMRKACAEGGMLFCPHDNYTDIYPDAENYSYDLVVFNLDGTPQKAWYHGTRHALSYRWAPHAFRPWCLRNAKLLREGYDPDAVFIDVLTAHGPFDYLDREGRFHTKAETSRHWGDAYQTYREGYRRPDAVCVSEAGQDHLVGVLDAGQSDHFHARKWLGDGKFEDSERTPWHDVATHNYFVLFAGGLGGRYQEDGWHKGGDSELHGYASDDYLSNAIIGGRNPMCDGPFSRNAVKTYWMQHDACAELGAAEFLDLRYEGGNIHRQHSFFSNGGEVWVNRQTNETWTLPNGVVLPPYGYYAKTPKTESGVVLKDGQRAGYAKGAEADFFDARKAATTAAQAVSRATGAKTVDRACVRVSVDWETRRAVKGYRPFVHVCKPGAPHEGIVFQVGLGVTDRMFATVGRHVAAMDVRVPDFVPAGTYEIRYGAWNPAGGGRLSMAGAARDGGSRVHGGDVIVEKGADGKVSRVTWRPSAIADKSSERSRVLGVNVAGKAVSFAGVKTDGSFRLLRPAAAPDEWRIVPLPHSDGFSAEIDLAAFGAGDAKVMAVEVLDAEPGAAAPTWSQTGATLKFACDARAFAYALRLAAGPERHQNYYKEFTYDSPDRTPVVYEGWSRSADAKAEDYCIWLDVIYADGTPRWAVRTDFTQGTHGWEHVRGVFVPEKPVRTIKFHAFLRKGAGKADFMGLKLERRVPAKGETFASVRRTNRPYADGDEVEGLAWNGRGVESRRWPAGRTLGVESPLPPNGAQVWTADSMERVTPLTFPATKQRAGIDLELARNESESAQIVVSTGRDCEWTQGGLSLSPLTQKDGTALKGSFTWNRVAYLARRTGYAAHPFGPPNEEKWFADPLFPAGAFRVRKGGSQSLWLTVRADRDAHPGLYLGKATVTERGEVKAVVPVSVRVRSFVQPDTFGMETAFCVMDGFTRAQYPDRYEEMRRQSWDLMLDHRLNPDDISRTTPPPLADLLYARSRGMNRFNVMNLVPPPKDRNVKWVCYSSASATDTPEFYDYVKRTLTPYVDELRKNGLMQYAYLYGFDEREHEYYPGIDRLWKKLKRDFPDLPLMTTAMMYRDMAKGAKHPCLETTDWYCPLSSVYRPELSAGLREKGKRVWWYTCCGPQYPYANMASYEYPPIEGRLLAWMMDLYRVDGLLFWHVNFWNGQKLIDSSDTFCPDWNTYSGLRMPGDGIFLYPTKAGVVPSIRLVQMRDAVEDFERLHMAAQKAGREAVDEVTKTLVKSMTDYVRDPAALRAARERLGDMIERGAAR